MFWLKEKEVEKVNYGKIIGITTAIVLGVAAIAAIAYKLWERYCCCLCDDCCDDLLDACDECDCDFCDDDDCIECACEEIAEPAVEADAE